MSFDGTDKCWKPIEDTISSHIRVYVCHLSFMSSTELNSRHRQGYTQTHTTTGCDQKLNILSAPSTSCVKTLLPQQHRKSRLWGRTQGLVGTRHDYSTESWAEWKNDANIQSIQIEFKCGTTSPSMPYASWELKSVWQALDNIHSLPHETLSQLSECSNLCERVGTNVIRFDAADDSPRDIALLSDPS